MNTKHTVYIDIQNNYVVCHEMGHKLRLKVQNKNPVKKRCTSFVQALDTFFAVPINIRKTCPCNEYPLKPHCYIGKLGYAGVCLFFLFLLQNIDCGYSLEPPRRLLLKIFIFYNFKNFCILHGHVFVMNAMKQSCGKPNLILFIDHTAYILPGTI